jgi:hypothetical protein
VSFRHLPVIVVTTILLAAPIASARADGPGPAVAALNGKLSVEGGVTGDEGESSGVGMVNGSITTPLGHAFGVRVDGLAGTAFNSFFGGGTAHLFWRDPAIGLFGPVASVQAGSGIRLGWYGAEADSMPASSPWGGYHERHNTAFYVNGALAEPSFVSVTAGIRIYFGPDKPLIHRHREDDPAGAAWASLAAELSSSAAEYDKVVSQLTSTQWQGPSAANLNGAAAPYADWLASLVD